MGTTTSPTRLFSDPRFVVRTLLLRRCPTRSLQRLDAAGRDAVPPLAPAVLLFAHLHPLRRDHLVEQLVHRTAGDAFSGLLLVGARDAPAVELCGSSGVREHTEETIGAVRGK